MKQYRKILMVLVLMPVLFIYNSCTNLDEETYDLLGQNTFGNSAEEMAVIVGPAYTSLSGQGSSSYIRRVMRFNMVCTDMALIPTRGTDWYDGGNYQKLREHTWDATHSEFRKGWSFIFSSITLINQILYQLEVAEDFGNKEMTMAQLRGLRAFDYMLLIDLYGNVPIVTDFTDLEPPTQKTRSEVFDFILSELLAIEDLVPVENNAVNYGRINQGVVRTMLAKTYLNAVVWKGTAMWSECVAVCDKVMSSGEYILESDWKLQFAANNEVSKENIFVLAFDEESGRFDMQTLTLHYMSPLTFDISAKCNNGMCADPDYVNLFAEDDPRKRGSFLWGPQHNAATGELIITGPGYPLDFTIDVPSFTEANQVHGARAIKYEYEKGGIRALNNDFVFFRYADIYLAKAEALLRSGGSEAEALNLVNAIRERAFGDSNHNLATVDLDAVLLERTFEFAWEEWRRQDLIRYEVASGQKYWTRAWRFKPEGDAHVLLFPIPQEAIDNNPNLSQNPGY